uniref:Uncharacterized protein n=1 Tax=Odontella aurita TaxID=265563 RepID=A0A7S4MPZ6_9STRA
MGASGAQQADEVSGDSAADGQARLDGSARLLRPLHRENLSAYEVLAKQLLSCPLSNQHDARIVEGFRVAWDRIMAVAPRRPGGDPRPFLSCASAWTRLLLRLPPSSRRRASYRDGDCGSAGEEAEADDGGSELVAGTEILSGDDDDDALVRLWRDAAAWLDALADDAGGMSPRVAAAAARHLEELTRLGAAAALHRGASVDGAVPLFAVLCRLDLSSAVALCRSFLSASLFLDAGPVGADWPPPSPVAPLLSSAAYGLSREMLAALSDASEGRRGAPNGGERVAASGAIAALVCDDFLDGFVSPSLLHGRGDRRSPDRRAALAECESLSSSFAAMDDALVRLVMIACTLASGGRVGGGGHCGEEDSSLFLSCVSFCRGVIDRISDPARRLDLLRLCASVAAWRGSPSTSHALLRTAVRIIPTVGSYLPALANGHQSDRNRLWMRRFSSSLAQYFGLFVVLPRSEKHGRFYLLRGVLNALAKIEWDRRDGAPPGDGMDLPRWWAIASTVHVHALATLGLYLQRDSDVDNDDREELNKIAEYASFASCKLLSHLKLSSNASGDSTLAEESFMDLINSLFAVTNWEDPPTAEFIASLIAYLAVHDKSDCALWLAEIDAKQ